MKEGPKYRGIFQYIAENFDEQRKCSPEERFWVRDLEENQYPKLEGPVNRVEHEFETTEKAGKNIRSFAEALGADLVGFTRVKEGMAFQDADVKGRFAIVLGLRMDHSAIATAPDPPAGKEALRAYWVLGQMVLKVAEYIRYLGYPAQGHQVRTFLKDPPTILHPLAAYHAGLGEFGRHGLLVTPEFGPRLRLGTITTDLELPDEGPSPFGVEEFCQNCDLCMEACRGDAIPSEMRMERGILKYTIDPMRCAPEFARYDGCGICIKVCPFNRTIPLQL
ncbi:MAG: 4Fe-4S dicluster domain-containing protein [Thermoplasmatota archaeon]